MKVKHLTKPQHPLMIMKLNKKNGNIVQSYRGIYENPTAEIHLTPKKSPPKIRTTSIGLIPQLFSIVLKVLAKEIRQEIE